MIGYYVRVLGDPALATIAEWQPSTFAPLNLPFVVILMGTLGLVCFARGKGVRLPADMMLLAVVLGALAAHAVRYQTWFALGVAPLLALAVTRTWSRRRGLAPPPRVIVIAAGALLLTVTVVAGGILVRTPSSAYGKWISDSAVHSAARYGARAPAGPDPRRRCHRLRAALALPEPGRPGGVRRSHRDLQAVAVPRVRPVRAGVRPVLGRIRPAATRWSRSRARCIPPCAKRCPGSQAGGSSLTATAGWSQSAAEWARPAPGTSTGGCRGSSPASPRGSRPPPPRTAAPPRPRQGSTSTSRSVASAARLTARKRAYCGEARRPVARNVHARLSAKLLVAAATNASANATG